MLDHEKIKIKRREAEHDLLYQAGWNAAIEAAAREAEGAAYDVASEIRKLKK